MNIQDIRHEMVKRRTEALDTAQREGDVRVGALAITSTMTDLIAFIDRGQELPTEAELEATALADKENTR